MHGARLPLLWKESSRCIESRAAFTLEDKTVKPGYHVKFDSVDYPDSDFENGADASVCLLLNIFCDLGKLQVQPYNLVLKSQSCGHPHFKKASPGTLQALPIKAIDKVLFFTATS